MTIGEAHKITKLERHIFRQDERIQDLELALQTCRDRFSFYVQHHIDKGDYVKAKDNEDYVKMIDAILHKDEM